VREAVGMRARVEAGEGMLFVSGLTLIASWLWYQNTVALSLWWGVAGVLVVGSLIGIVRSFQLILSAFSGFGRNFHEQRESLDPSPDDEAYDHAAAISAEATKVAVVPGLLVATGVIAVLLRVLPGLNVPDGFPDMNFVSPHFLVPWMAIAGFGAIAWCVTVLRMMKTGPDRWTFVSGTRESICRSMRTLIILGVALIMIAGAFTLIS